MKTTLKASADPTRTRSALLLIPIGDAPGKPTGVLAAADAHVGGAIGRAIADGEVRGKAKEATVFHAAGASGPRRVALVGVGADTDRAGWQAAGSTFAKLAAKARVSNVAVALPSGISADDAQALVEGVWLGA